MTAINQEFVCQVEENRSGKAIGGRARL